MFSVNFVAVVVAVVVFVASCLLAPVTVSVAPLALGIFVVAAFWSGVAVALSHVSGGRVSFAVVFPVALLVTACCSVLPFFFAV